MAWKFAFLALCLGGCGVVYTAPSVTDGAVSGLGGGTDFDVAVVPLTYESAAAANLVPYIPARLPAAYQPGTTAKAALPGVPRLGPLPQPSALAAPAAFLPENFPPLIAPQPYRIGVADVILLSVSGPVTAEDLPALITAQSKRQGYIVQDDGAIAIPDAGRVRVAGLSLQEAEAEIFRALVAARIDPSFSLEIAEFNSQRVAVGGAVAAPKLVPITLKPLYLHEAVALAGGITAGPQGAQVTLARAGELYRINLDRFLADPAARQVVLLDGDVIGVTGQGEPASETQAFDQRLALRAQEIQTGQFLFEAEMIAAEREANAQAALAAERQLFQDRLALGAVEQHHAYRAGEVRKPGRFALPFERAASLADVLFDEGGMAIETADYAEIYLLRAASDPGQVGSLTAYHLDAENAVNLAVAPRMEVRPGDVVFVTEQPITSWNRVVSQMFPQLFLGAANLATQ